MAECTEFKEANITFLAPQGMANCSDMKAHVTDEFILSCWQLTWRERFSALFFGKAWHFHWTQRAPAPVGISIARTVFAKEAK